MFARRKRIRPSSSNSQFSLPKERNQLLKFSGRVGTEFSEKLLRSLHSEFDKTRIEECPFFNLPAAGRSRWARGLSSDEMKRCRWVKPAIVARVKFAEWTRDDRLRQPVFLGIREDKDVKEVVCEKAI
jgi:bifunctional non-homologous end joining protein LigD